MDIIYNENNEKSYLVKSGKLTHSQGKLEILKLFDKNIGNTENIKYDSCDEDEPLQVGSPELPIKYGMLDIKLYQLNFNRIFPSCEYNMKQNLFIIGEPIRTGYIIRRILNEKIGEFNRIIIIGKNPIYGYTNMKFYYNKIDANLLDNILNMLKSYDKIWLIIIISHLELDEIEILTSSELFKKISINPDKYNCLFIYATEIHNNIITKEHFTKYMFINTDYIKNVSVCIAQEKDVTKRFLINYHYLQNDNTYIEMLFSFIAKKENYWLFRGKKYDTIYYSD